MTDQYILAIDLGTSGPKVALFSTRGVVLDGEAEPVGLAVLPHGGVEQDPHEWWAAICTATRRLLARQAVAQAVVGVCVTAQWSGTVAVDAQGEPLLPAMIWMDDRGARYIRRVTGGFPSVQGYGAIRLWTWIRRTAESPPTRARTRWRTSSFCSTNARTSTSVRTSSWSRRTISTCG